MNKLATCVVTGALLVLSSLANADILPGKPTVLITGSNRGIGLGFVKQLPSAAGMSLQRLALPKRQRS